MGFLVHLFIFHRNYNPLQFSLSNNINLTFQSREISVLRTGSVYRLILCLPIGLLLSGYLVIEKSIEFYLLIH